MTSPRAVLPILMLVLASCASPPPLPAPLLAPEVDASVHYLPTGAASSDAAVTTALEDALLVKVTWLVLESMPSAVLPSVHSTSVFMATTTAQRPFLSASGLLEAAQFGTISDVASFLHDLAVRHEPIAESQALLLADDTVVIRLTEADQTRGTREEPTSVALDLRRDREANAVEVSVSLTQSREVRVGDAGDDMVGLAPTTPAASAPDPPTASVSRELALLDRRPIRATDRCALVVASPFPGGGRRAVAAAIEITMPTAGDVGAITAELTAARAQYRAMLAGTPSDLPDVSEATQPGVAKALEALADPEHQRRGLSYLASITGSALVLDLVLIAQAPLLADAAAAVRTELLGQHATDDLAAVRWMLERMAWLLLAGKLERSETTPALDAILGRHAGEVGRHPDVLQRIVPKAQSSAAMDQALLDGNREFLEDTSLAARARALDWLGSRALAPAGFDPMAPVKERRLVLERDAEARAAAASGEQR